MRDLEQTDVQRTERLDRYRKLIVEAWRRQRIPNKEMASRIGRSLSLTNKLKAGTTPLTGPIIDQFVEALGIDPVRAMFAVDIAYSHMSYFDPKFHSACTTAITFFDQIMVQCGYGKGIADLAAAEDLTAERVEATARAAAASLATAFVQRHFPGQGVS